MRIVIIGTGNTATVLGRLLKQKEHSVVQVFGRNREHAGQLGKIVGAPFTIDKNAVDREADLYLIAVSDNAITDIVSWLHVDKRLVVHTAGSVDAGILYPSSKNYGVLYPVQSLRKEMENIHEIPFLVEGNTPDNGAVIFDLANSIGKQVKFANTQQRLMVHIAAIFVNNFTNHLYTLAEDFCDREGVDFDMLFPLINETARRLHESSPAEVQTGPAIRNDTYTIEKHLQLLESYPFHRPVYQMLSRSILEWKNNRI